MGCDIHDYIETRDDSGAWTAFGNWSDQAAKYYEEGEKPEEPIVLDTPYKERVYGDRNYELFSILADVRNGYGFAGVDTGDGFVPISAPRGLPEDVTQLVRDVSESWGVDAHSHSWFTLDEILEYDWTQTTKRRGWVTLAEYHQWSRWKKSHGEPPSEWCGSVSGGNTEHLTLAGADKLIETLGGDFWKASAALKSDRYASHYVPVEWCETYSRCTRGFWTDSMPKLLRLASKAGGFDRVRLVFWFDN